MSGGDATGKGWWRTVLGEYPTGVSLITTRDADTNEPIGMVVGTFSAVSEDPPMVGFMPVRSSYNWGRVRESGRFCVSVLGAGHEELCRNFASRHEDRFSVGEWTDTPGGLPRLSDAVVWFEADIADVFPGGDHDIVTGHVSNYGMGADQGGMPLLYLKGGYGSFTIPTLEFNVQGLSTQLRVAEAARNPLRDLAKTLNFECFVATLVKESVVVLMAANVGPDSRGSELVGQAFPWAAPVASVFAAWSDEERLKIWAENSRHLIGAVNRELMNSLIDRVLVRGFAISVGTAMGESFDRIVGNPESGASELSNLWDQLNEEYVALTEQDDWVRHVSAMQAPIFDENAHTVFELYVSIDRRFTSDEQFNEVADRLLGAAAEITSLIGGRLPDGYPPTR